MISFNETGKMVSKHQFYFKDIQFMQDGLVLLKQALDIEAADDEDAACELERVTDLIKDLHYVLLHKNDGSQVEIEIQKN